MNRKSQLRAALLVPLVAAAGCNSLPPPHPFENADLVTPERDVAVLYGLRDFEAQSDFGSTDEQTAGGIEVSWSHPDEPLAYELALQHSYDKDRRQPNGETEASVTDLQLGLRYLFARAGIFRPYVGSGLAILYGKFKQDGFGLPRVEEDEWDLGVYAHAGVWAPFGDEVRIGFDVRWVPEEWLSEGEFDLDHTQLAITIGTGF